VSGGCEFVKGQSHGGLRAAEDVRAAIAILRRDACRFCVDESADVAREYDD